VYIKQGKLSIALGIAGAARASQWRLTADFANCQNLCSETNYGPVHFFLANFCVPECHISVLKVSTFNCSDALLPIVAHLKPFRVQISNNY